MGISKFSNSFIHQILHENLIMRQMRSFERELLMVHTVKLLTITLISRPEILKDLLNPVELNQPLQTSKKWGILLGVSNIKINSKWRFPISL